MLQPIFPLFSSGASTFASANVPREHGFCYTLKDEDFGLVTLGKEGLLYLGDTFSLLVLYYRIQFTHLIALKLG